MYRDAPQVVACYNAYTLPAVFFMQSKLPKPYKKAIIYEDDKLYACLANYPITKGHVVVVWKDKVVDLHLLSDEHYDHLMERVDQIRTAMLNALNIKKVYLIYMDETNQVHWHLIPRYNEKGFDVFDHKPKDLKDFSLAEKIRNHLVLHT